MAGAFHSIIVKELKKLGKNRGFVTDESGKELKDLKQKGYKIRPDVVWNKDGKIKYVFEVDKGAYDNYPKTIYGSVLIYSSCKTNPIFATKSVALSNISFNLLSV